MAKKQVDKSNDKERMKRNRSISKALEQTRKLLGNMSISLYGSDRKSQTNYIVDRFDTIMSNDSLVDKDLTDSSKSMSSFINNVFNMNTKRDAASVAFSDQLDDITASTSSATTAYLEQVYQNRKIKQIDIQEVTSNLVELEESINITKDAIISPDATTGKMLRELVIEDTEKDDSENVISAIETMEDKLDTLNIIHKFIVPHTLKFGEYYVYSIPYKEIFKKFMRQRDNIVSLSHYTEDATVSLLDFTKEEERKKLITESANGEAIKPKKDNFIENVFKIYNEACEHHGGSIFTKEAFTKDMEAVMGNITITNDPIPLPVCLEGVESVGEYMKEYVTESGDRMMNEAEIANREIEQSGDLFRAFTNSNAKRSASEGLYGSINNKKRGSSKGLHDFDDIKDVYIKLLNPISVLPVKLMNKVLGYYYIIEDNNSSPNVTSGKFSAALYSDPFSTSRDEHTIISQLADRIVKSFNKEFLKKNLAFRDTIVEAIQYINITNKRIRFQYIPAEYMDVFKVDQDEEGNGVSMIDKSVSYARLYLTLLMFKIMTIITQSNDTRVNYVRQSPIDKDITNKIQRIIRKKQNRSVNLQDLWSYTAVTSKINGGSEMYVPVGTGNERALETEILSGQDVQLHTDLLELLKNNYILATGVPAAIINYLSEADFAKVVEQNNTKFLARCINYTLDFNRDITNWYKKLMRWSTNIDSRYIDRFVFKIPEPKGNNNNVKNELMSSFDQFKDSVSKILQGDDFANMPEQKFFVKRLAKEYLPSIDWANLEEMLKQSKIEAGEEALRNPENSDGDDFGLDGMNL